MRNWRKIVESKLESMEYAAAFTVLICDEDQDYRFEPGCIADEELFKQSDAGDDLGWSNDNDEVLHIEYAYFVFGAGPVAEADYSDLEWIAENFEKIEVLCDLRQEGRYRLFNPHFNGEGGLE